MHLHTHIYICIHIYRSLLFVMCSKKALQTSGSFQQKIYSGRELTQMVYCRVLQSVAVCCSELQKQCSHMRTHTLLRTQCLLTHTHTHTHTYTYTYTCTHAHTHIHNHTTTHTHTIILMHERTSGKKMCIHACMYMYIYVYVYVLLYTHAHTYMYT